MFFLLTTINTRKSFPVLQGEQLTTEDWLAQLYEEGEYTAPPQPYNRQSENFYNTWTVRTNHYAKQHQHLPKCWRALQELDAAITAFEQEHGLDNMAAHYTQFFIPKHSGGMREINAPSHELKQLMWQIKSAFENSLRVQYHDRAYAYFKGRGIKDAMMVHQANGSKWFLKIDLKDFFPKTGKNFIHRQLRKLYPFYQLYQLEQYALILDRILNLCMLNGGLPQGTPLSPMLTNLAMLPFDWEITKKLGEIEGQHFEYTRYADDITISSRHTFNPTELSALIAGHMREREMPYRINNEKTRYGSSAGKNWNLGLMLNKDNNITLGHKKKERLRAGINNFLKDFTNGILWDRIDLLRLLGNLSHLNNIEPSYCEYVINEYANRYNVIWGDCVSSILRD